MLLGERLDGLLFLKRFYAGFCVEYGSEPATIRFIDPDEFYVSNFLSEMSV